MKKRALVTLAISVIITLGIFGWVYYASYPAYVKAQGYFNQIPPYHYATATNFPGLLAPLASSNYQVRYTTKDRWEDVFTWYYQHIPSGWHVANRDNGSSDQIVSFTNDSDSYRVSFDYQTSGSSSSDHIYTVTISPK